MSVFSGRCGERRHFASLARIFASLTLIFITPALCQQAQTKGVVRDALGRAIPGATVSLVNSNGQTAAQATSGEGGEFVLVAQEGSYRIHASHAGFADVDRPVQLRDGVAQVSLTLDIAPVQQSVVVTATGLESPESQVAETVSAITANELSRADALTADDALRLAPGVQVIRQGGVGGVTTLAIRGSDSTFTKFLLDGIPTERADFGFFDTSTLTPIGVNSVEIVRGPDSVLYGSDAISGVIDLRTRRADLVDAAWRADEQSGPPSASGGSVDARPQRPTGASQQKAAEPQHSPELNTENEYGSFGTVRQYDQLLGLAGRLDGSIYYGYTGTHNQVPNNRFRNATYGGNGGWRLTPALQLRATARYANTFSGQPNAVDAYGIADDSFQHQGETYTGISATYQTTSAWQNELTAYQTKTDYFFDNPSPTGIFDGFDYLGRVTTFSGANGYSVTGQAILDFGPGSAYPAASALDSSRHGADLRSRLELTPGWRLLGGYRYYDERGLSVSDRLSRHNHGAFVEVSGVLFTRLFATAGVSVDRNTPFGTTSNPQGSVAWFARLSRDGFVNETRLRASAGTALKDPSLLQQSSSLYQTLLATGSAAAAQQLGIQPIRPERARDIDFGVDQFLAGDRVRLSETLFRNRYYDVIEFVPTSAFPLLGVPAAAESAASANGGADLNSGDQLAKGAESELLVRSRSGWHAQASYTYLDARVVKTYNYSAFFPVFNPAFPAIPIGAFAPLVGGRPFRRAPHSANFEAGLERLRWSALLRGYFASRRDDSTFLTDPSYGNSLLLPNHNLLPGYFNMGATASFRLAAGLTFHGAIDNLFNRRYEEAFGYPALGRTMRIGVRWDPLTQGRHRASYN